MSRDNAKIVELWENAQQKSTPSTNEDGTVFWRLPDGKLHRLDGPAVIDAEGREMWFKNGIRHREDGPALTFLGGTKAWYQQDLQHRLDGPAIVFHDGSVEWIIWGQQYNDVYSWAAAALKCEGINDPTEEQVNAKVQQTLAKNVLD